MKDQFSFSQDLGCFSLHPIIPVSLAGASQHSRSSVDSSDAPRKRGGRTRGGEDSLSSLPYEVLRHMAGFLDSLSLSQLSLVSQTMRQVCSSLLQERGMVTLCWEKKIYSHGGAKWKAKPVRYAYYHPIHHGRQPHANCDSVSLQVWQFSHLFSSVDSWQMADVPPISAHLKVCPYYETSLHSEPVPLLSMSNKQECSQERMSLVNHFARNRLQQ